MVKRKKPGKPDGNGRRPPFRDPYLAWAFATGFRYLGRPQRFPVLLGLNTTAAKFVDLAREHPEVITVPGLFAKPPAGLEGAKFCTASVTPAFFEPADANAQLKEFIEHLELGLPGLSLPDIPSPDPWEPTRPVARVVTAVMDDGLAFANNRFRRADGTSRMAYLWKQDAPGLILTASGIKAALDASTHAGMVDEEEVYRRLGFENNALRGHKPLARRRAHGTHVMDLACGLPAVPGAPERPIIGVQFPSLAVRDTAGAWLLPHVVSGLLFILHAADLIAAAQGSGPLPIVANISYGKFADSHDGKSLLEWVMDEIIRLRRKVAPFTVVLPSGNSYLDRCHAHFSLSPDQARTLHWRVQPDDRTPSFLEIWPGPVDGSGMAPALEVQVFPPATSTPVLALTRGLVVPPWSVSGWVLASAEYQASGSPVGPHRDRVTVQLAPTATLDATEGVAPAGTWKIVVRNTDPSREAEVNAWVQRDDTPYGWPITGRQSCFDDPSYQRFHPAGCYVRADAAGTQRALDDPGSYAKRAGSINAIATGDETVVIGAFRKNDNTASGYSAGGPLLTPGNRAGFDPDAMAVGDDSIACGGVLGAGTRSGAAVSMRGTSVAAPQITRWLADQMAVGAAADRSAVQGLASTGSPVPAVSSDRQGNGRIDVRPPPRVPRR